MSPGIALLGAVVLGAVGAWTVTHPDGGYRASGGVGSGFSPSTRRVCGVALIVVAVLIALVALADPAMA